MNSPIRRLGIVVALMFCALLVASTMIQFVQASDLDNKPGNRRTLLASYSKERGSILVDGNAVAVSKPTDDDLKWRRTYPQGDLYAAVTGYYSFTYGSSGIERAENDFLSGDSKELFYRRLVDIVTGRPQQGASVELTLSAKVQKAATKALGGQRGAVVAIDPKTGAILAMVTHPTYDPNVLAGHDLNAVSAAWKKLTKAPHNPMINRAINGNLYPPGSTFKLVTTAAALSTGDYTPDSTLPGPARLPLPQTSISMPTDDGRPCGPDDKTSFTHALQVSCNTAYASVGMDIGQDALRQQAHKFGWDSDLSIPMSVTPSSFPKDLNKPQLAQTAIGQYDVRATPLQIAMVSSAIANGGSLMKPHLVKTIRDKDLDVIKSTDPDQLSQAVDPEVAKQLTTMMEAVVTGGTGTTAAIPGTKVAGKTGTAQTGDGQIADDWFTGFAPADNPQVAVAVVVENGGHMQEGSSGATVAGPIARKVMEAVISK